MTHRSGARSRVVKPLDALLRESIDASVSLGATTSEILLVLWKIEKDLTFMAFDEIDRLKRAARKRKERPHAHR